MTRGEIWWADLGLPFGSEPGFRRPILILQNDAFTRSKLNTIIIAPLTTNLSLAAAPGNTLVKKRDSRLPADSVINLSQIVTIDKLRLIEKVGKLNPAILKQVDEGIKLVLALR